MKIIVFKGNWDYLNYFVVYLCNGMLPNSLTLTTYRPKQSRHVGSHETDISPFRGKQKNGHRWRTGAKSFSSIFFLLPNQLILDLKMYPRFHSDIYFDIVQKYSIVITVFTNEIVGLLGCSDGNV